jgi:hypothetical protein
MFSNLIALPYKAARLPLSIVDKAVGDRLPETSAPRVALDRTLGSADVFAGSVLRNPVIAQRGAERLDRSEKLLTAARLEQQAEARREQAVDTAVSGTKEAAQKRKAAQKRVASGLEEADAAEARGKQQAKAEAEKTAAAKKSAAQKRAQTKKSTAEQRKKSAESAADAKTKVAQRKARNELDAAREKKQAAAEARADADRLEELAEAKKQRRRKTD